MDCQGIRSDGNSLSWRMYAFWWPAASPDALGHISQDFCCRRVSCESKGDGKPSSSEEHTSNNGSKKSSKTPGSRGPLRRLMKSLGGATIFGQKMYRVIGNVGLLLLLGHFLPIGGRSPLTGEQPNISIEVRLKPLKGLSTAC